MRGVVRGIDMKKRLISLLFIFLLFTPLMSPVAAEWEEDSWLINIIGPERLAMGDEFGCHGMPESSLLSNVDVISQCREYLTDRIHASEWGSEPLSFGLPDGEISSELQEGLQNSGFYITDSNGAVKNENASLINYNGGSLEKNIGSKSNFLNLVDSGTPLINFHWMARDHDAIVRPETDLINSIESTTAWFTTWGEYYSYQNSINNFSVSDNGTGEWVVEHQLFESNYWLVPTTSVFNNLNATVVKVSYDLENLSELTSIEGHLQEGWRQSHNSLFLTLMPGKKVTIYFDKYDFVNFNQTPSSQFNGHELAITVAGHHTNDLFDWSRRWDESPMRFTWLIEPRMVGGFSWLLPAIAVLVALIAPVAIISLVRKDKRAQYVVEVFDSLESIKFGEE